MTHSFKRILSLVLTFAMVLSCVPAQVFATESCAHSYEVTVTEPTCTEDGSIDYVCSLCGDSYSEPGVAAEGHDYQESDLVDATCAEAGTVTYACTVCGDAVTDEIPATGEHSYAEGICTVCGAEDPDAAPAEEPAEEPTEEAAEEPTEELVEVPVEPDATDAAAAEGEDGENIDMSGMAGVVAKVAATGETFTTLEAAIMALSGLEERTVFLMADYTVTQPIHIYTDVLLYNEENAESHTITAAEGVDVLFDVGKNGFLLADHVNMVTSGDYIIELTADTAGLLLNTCDLSGATAAAVHVDKDVDYVAEEYTNEDGSTGLQSNIQIYGGTISGNAALHLEGTGSLAFVAGNAPVLEGTGTDGAIVMDGDSHSIEMYGITMNADSYAFTMNGNSVLQAGGVTFNGESYDDPWNTALPQSGAVARMDIGYYGDIQAAMDAATEVNYGAEEGTDTSDWSIPLTVLEELTISDTVTLEATQFPVALRGKNITLTEDGAIHVNGHLRLENLIYMGLGTVYVPEGGEFEWWGGDVIGHITWPGEEVDHLSAYWVHNQNEGWFENIYQYHPNSHSIRMVPGESHFLSFYKNVWDADNGKWIRTSIAPDAMTLPEHISVTPLSEYDWVEFRDGEVNAENFVDLIVEPDMPWDTHPVITVDGIPYTVHVERESRYGFYSAPEATNENWLTNYWYNKFRTEDSFYFIFTAEDYTLDSVALAEGCADKATLEATDDPNVWKITLTDAARALNESENSYNDFNIDVNVVAKDASGNDHYWGHGIYCDAWIKHAEDGGEMSHADLMFAIDAMQNVNDWAGVWIHESVTTLDPSVIGGILDIDLGVRESDSYNRAFELADNGKIIVPDGCTLIINSRTIVTGGLIEVQSGGKLIINDILHTGTGTVYLENGAYYEENFNLMFCPITWESDAKDDYISAAWANAENGVFYATIDEFDMPSFQEHEMLPGYGNPLVFYFNHWNGSQWECTPIRPEDMGWDDGLNVVRIMDMNDFSIRDDQEYGECFIMLQTEDDADLWDTVQHVYYRNCSFPVYIQRDYEMGFYSEPKVSNETFLDEFGFGPGRDNTFYFIVTDENLTLTGLELVLQAGPENLEGGYTAAKYADNIWKITLADDIVSNMNRNLWLNARASLETADGSGYRTGRGMNLFPWTWNLGMPDAGFNINGQWVDYYADEDAYITHVQDEATGWFSPVAVEMPEGVSYDLATNTMTLNNATLGILGVGYHWHGWDENGNPMEGYNLPNPDFTLKLIGENCIGDGSSVALRLSDELNATITGDGSLYVFNYNENPQLYNYNAADVYNANLTIGGSVNVTFHVEGENYWEDGSPALMHSLIGSDNSTLRVTDNAVLTMEVPEVTRDARPGRFNGGYQGLVNFGEIIVEKQATVNLDSLEVSSGQIFHLKGGTVNVNAHPSIYVMNEETGDLRYFYDAVLINEGGQLNVNGGKMNVNVESDQENARYTGFNVMNGSLHIFGGSINLTTNVLGPAIHVGGYDASWLYMGGGTFTYTDNYTGEEKNTLINVEHNSRARFNGGTIIADGGMINFMAEAPEGEMEGVTWTGTSLKGNGTWITVDGNFKMSSGLIQLNEGRMEVENSAVFTGGTLDMNDSTMIVNGVVQADMDALLDFEMTDRAVEVYEDNTAIEINNYFAVSGNARVNVDVAFENIQNANGENIPFSGIRNHAMFHQMGGTVTITSNAYYDTFSSYGNVYLNAGEMNLIGASGIQQNFDETQSNNFEMQEGMTLIVYATRCGVALANAQILGGTMYIAANGENGTFGLYSVPGATVDITGGIHNIVAHSTGEGTVGLGLLADNSYIHVSGEALVNVEADEAATCWMFPEGTTSTITGTITDADGIELNNWQVNGDNSLLVHADGAAATNITINANAAPKTLQELLPTLDRDPGDGSYMLTVPAVVNESMRLVDADGNPVQLHVLRGGKITVRNGAVLTIPAGGVLVAHSNWEDNGVADGAIFVEAGGRIMNNGVLANDGGFVSIQNSTTRAGYVHGGNAAAVSHYKNGELYPIHGVAESYQELNAIIASTEELHAVLDEIRDYSQDGAKIRYGYAYIWCANGLCLDDVVIPENTGMDIVGQGEKVDVTLSKGAVMENYGYLSMGNVNFTLDGELYNFGELHTYVQVDSNVTINGTYHGYGNGQVYLNKANVTVNGDVIQHSDTASLDINDGSVVTVADGGLLQLSGDFRVGSWKMSAAEAEDNFMDPEADYSYTAGTLNVEGQVDIYGHMYVAPFGEASGGVVNIKDGGNLTIVCDDNSEIYGSLDLSGEMNVETDGTLDLENYAEIYGVLNVSGSMSNRGEVGLFGELNVSGNLFNQVSDNYYGSFFLYDSEDGTGAKLTASEGANFYNEGSIRSIGCNGIIDMEKAATFASDADSSEICLDWGENGALTECKGVDNELVFLVYEGDNASAAIAMAAHASENGYRDSIVRVVGPMEIGYNQSLDCGYLIVMPEGELEVNGFVIAHTRLFVRDGGKMTIGTNGWVISETEMRTFGANEWWPASIVENRGALECAPNGTMQIDGEYDDFGVGTIYNICLDGSMADIYGEAGNVGPEAQTLFTSVLGENGEQQLRDILAVVKQDGYRNAIINILTDVNVGFNLDIPENVRVRVTAQGENVGTMTVSSKATVNNMGTIVADRPYAALLVDSGSFGGSGVYHGYCGSDAEYNNENLLWTLQNGVLTISGDGAMANYTYETPAPWLNLNVSKVVLGAAVTCIGDFAFQKCNASMIIPKGLVHFGTYCFGGGMNLKVYHNSAAEEYLLANYAGAWDYIHEVADGECIVDGCDYGLDSVMNNGEISAEDKKEELKNNFDTDSLKTEMENKETFVEQLEQLEQEIQEERSNDTGIEIGVSIQVEEGVEDVIADAFESVEEHGSILGAVLNAVEEATEVKLVLGNPEKADIEDKKFDSFNRDASVLFSMTMEGVHDASNLDIPVKITLPVPANVRDLTKLVVMHYHGGNEDGDRVNFTLFTDENGKAFVTFVLSGFSDFLVGEDVTPVTLTAKVNPGTVTKGASADDIAISLTARTAWTDKSNHTVTDLAASYIITDADGKDVTLEDALATEGTYTIKPEFVANTKYDVTVKPATLTVEAVQNVCVNTVTGEAYESISAALAAAKSGDTVTLLSDATAENGMNEEILIVSAGRTLDLNGHYLEVENLIAFGNVIDSKGDTIADSELEGDVSSEIADDTETGGIINYRSAGEFIKLDTENAGYIPIYDIETHSYKFYSGSIVSLGGRASGSSAVKFGIRILMDSPEGYYTLGRAGENSDINVLLDMTWTGTSGFEMVYPMKDATVAQFGALAYEQAKLGKDVTKAMTLTVSGLDKLGSGAEVTCKPMLQTESQFATEAAMMVYTVPAN